MRAEALVALLCAIWFLGMALEPRRKLVCVFRLLALAAFAVRPWLTPLGVAFIALLFAFPGFQLLGIVVEPGRKFVFAH